MKINCGRKEKNIYLDFFTLIQRDFCDSQEEIICKSRLREVISEGQMTEQDVISIDKQFGRRGERKRGNVIEENDEEKRTKD